MHQYQVHEPFNLITTSHVLIEHKGFRSIIYQIWLYTSAIVWKKQCNVTQKPKNAVQIYNVYRNKIWSVFSHRVNARFHALNDLQIRFYIVTKSWSMTIWNNLAQSFKLFQSRRIHKLHQKTRNELMIYHGFNMFGFHHCSSPYK